MNSDNTIQAILWRNDCLSLLDQRLLPHQERYLELTTSSATATAIRDMVVRGAPAIGITAAYGLVLAAAQRLREGGDWRAAMEADFAELAASRPTAVNLCWALQRMRDVLERVEQEPYGELLAEAQRIQAQDIAANRKLGDLGAALLEPGSGVLTHCNAGALATGGYGTALGVVRSAFATRKIQEVYADETRPWLQGARLTAWELLREGIPTTLIVEGAAAALMQAGKVHWVIVGTDRVAANGDVANKIGTYGLAILARHHGVRFMVAAPSSTVDMDVACGEEIPIESRSEEEVLSIAGHASAASGATAWNPVFDITPAELVDVLVTERGVVQQPDSERIAAMMRK